MVLPGELFLPSPPGKLDIQVSVWRAGIFPGAASFHPLRKAGACFDEKPNDSNIFLKYQDDQWYNTENGMVKHMPLSSFLFMFLA